VAYDPGTECPTPSCVEMAEKYGGRVTDTQYHKNPTCECCGGQRVDSQWKHTCKKCGKNVEPGQLGGLFVPHLCPDCLAHRRATDVKCSRCRQPDIDCCC
jgi:hypothetical protein